MDNKKVIYTLLGAAAVGVGIYVALKYFWTEDKKREEEGLEEEREGNVQQP